MPKATKPTKATKSSSNSKVPDGSASLERAKKLFAEGKLVESKTLFGELTNLGIQGLYGTGLTWLAMGDDRAAARHFHRCIAIDPNHFNACYYLGDIFERHNQHGFAARFYHRTLYLNPGHRPALSRVQRYRLFLFRELCTPSDGLEVVVKIREQLNDKRGRRGDSLLATIIKPASLFGTKIKGQIDAAKRSGDHNEDVSLTFSFSSVIFDEEAIPIISYVKSVSGRSNRANRSASSETVINLQIIPAEK